MNRVEINVITGEMTVITLTEEEIAQVQAENIESAWTKMRQKRDELLRISDISVLPDRWNLMTPEKQGEWSTYRQALRDLPSTITDILETINWPVKPE